MVSLTQANKIMNDAKKTAIKQHQNQMKVRGTINKSILPSDSHFDFRESQDIYILCTL